MSRAHGAEGKGQMRRVRHVLCTLLTDALRYALSPMPERKDYAEELFEDRF